MTATIDLAHAVQLLKAQQVIAYPTEAVFGLGCDPDSSTAIQQILQLKQRPANKGLILIAADLQQLASYIDLSQLNTTQLQTILASWPGPVTWAVPKSGTLNPLLSGAFDTIAVRVSDHPLVQQLCNAFGKAVVSTSANLSGQVAAKTAGQVAKQFPDVAILQGEVAGRTKPSMIRDARSGQILRQG